MKIYLIAGEASGDVIGSLLIQSLRNHHPEAAFYGIGGPLMEREGLRSLFPVEELSIMGISEVLPRLKDLLGRIRETGEHIRKIGPDLLITIDAPDFCFRVVQNLRNESAEGVKPVMVHYVAPTVWAWRPGRAKKVAALYDGLLCLFPFEPPYFLKHQLPAAYVGHPVMQQGFIDISGIDIREEMNIPPGAKVVGLFFGSRQGEIDRHGDILTGVAIRLQKEYPDLQFLVPSLPHIESHVRGLLKNIRNAHVIVDPDRKPQIFSAMNAAIAVSGTVALELAVANVPHVIAYRMKPLTWQIVRLVIKVRFAHLANILLNKEVVPEFIQEQCTADNIVTAIKPLMKDGLDVDNQCAEFATVRKLLNGKTKEPPSDQAARFVLEIFKQKTDKTFIPYAKAS